MYFYCAVFSSALASTEDAVVEFLHVVPNTATAATSSIPIVACAVSVSVTALVSSIVI